MSHTQLLHLSESIKKDQEKLNQVERSISNITRQIVNKDIQIIESETSKISKFAGGIQSIISNVKTYRQGSEKVVVELNRQASDLKQKISQYDKEFRLNNKEKQYKKQIEQHEKKYVNEWQKRIQLANEVDVKTLLKVECDDRKSPAHEAFKWIIVAIYGEPEAKYYLPNFKDQVFARDEGKDFKERLGKINASTAKEEAKLKSTDFLNRFPQIVRCSELNEARSQIQKIRTIAEIFLNCLEIAKRIKEFQVAIQKSREESRQKDQEVLRWKAKLDALEDRIKTNTEYLSVLGNIESKLQGKVESYKEKQGMAKEVVGRLKRNQSIPELELTIENDKRDVCECSIF